MAEVQRGRLRKSRAERMVFGVAGGLGDYLEVDPVLVRAGFVVLGFIGGLGLLAYIGFALLMPDTPEDETPPEAALENGATVEGQGPASLSEHRGRYVFGIILIGLGVILLIEQLGLLAWLDWGVFWSIVLILIGVAAITGRMKR